MATRNGKIAHLPFELREELNVRLSNGEPGNLLVEWLNTNPAVIDVVNTHFSGRPISEQNLSEWRNGGYEQWATLNACLGETSGLSESAGLIAENGIDTGNLLLVISAHYAAMIQRWNLTPAEDLDRMMRIFKNLTHAVLAIRRSEQRDARLEIDRERLELLREKQCNKSASASSSPASSSTNSAPAESISTSGPAYAAGHPHPVNTANPVNPHAPAASPSPAASPAVAPPRPGPSASHQELSDPPAASPSRPSALAGGSPCADSTRNPMGLL
jgi:hypothetical protein